MPNKANIPQPKNMMSLNSLIAVACFRNMSYSQEYFQLRRTAGEQSELTLKDSKEEHNFALTIKAKCMALSEIQTL